MSNAPVISVIVPAHNEEGNIQALYKALRRSFEDLYCDAEIIFVDDGSTDETAEIVRELHEEDSDVKLVRLARNFGQPAAISAGMLYASGDAVITMDADLQHPPTLLPAMIEQWKNGYDVVLTQRSYGRSVGIWKRSTSRLYSWLINRLCDRPVLAGATDFRLLSRNVVDQLNRLPERNRFMRGLVSWVGFKQVAIPYTAEARHAGISKYTFRKLLRTATDGITSFSTVPLRVATYLGIASSLVGMPYAVWAVWARLFTEEAVPGWASLIVAILFLGGVQLMCLGVLGEYVGRIYDEVKARPLFITDELRGFDSCERKEMTAQPAALERIENLTSTVHV